MEAETEEILTEGRPGHENRASHQALFSREDAAPYDRDYAVDVAPTDRILDALLAVQSRQDGSLSFRKSCAHGVCGSDAMVIEWDGAPGLQDPGAGRGGVPRAPW